MYKNAIINVHTHGRKNMEPYKQMYYHLFNAVTNALEAMASGKPAEAAALLRKRNVRRKNSILPRMAMFKTAPICNGSEPFLRMFRRAG